MTLTFSHGDTPWPNLTTVFRTSAIPIGYEGARHPVRCYLNVETRYADGRLVRNTGPHIYAGETLICMPEFSS